MPLLRRFCCGWLPSTNDSDRVWLLSPILWVWPPAQMQQMKACSRGWWMKTRSYSNLILPCLIFPHQMRFLGATAQAGQGRCDAEAVLYLFGTSCPQCGQGIRRGGRRLKLILKGQQGLPWIHPMSFPLVFWCWFQRLCINEQSVWPNYEKPRKFANLLADCQWVEL